MPFVPFGRYAVITVLQKRDHLFICHLRVEKNRNPCAFIHVIRGKEARLLPQSPDQNWVAFHIQDLYQLLPGKAKAVRWDLQK